MTHAARIEAYDRNGRRLKWDEGNVLMLRFPLDKKEDWQRSRFILDSMDSKPWHDFPENTHIVTVSFTSAMHRAEDKLCLAFIAKPRCKKLELI